MIKAPISLQDLRRSLYVKAKAELSWRFWGLYVHVCKMETLREAVARVARAIVEEKTRIIDLDLSAYFDNVQHSLLLEKVARRVQDDAVMHLLKMILKATGKKGVPQGGVISPLAQ